MMETFVANSKTKTRNRHCDRCIQERYLDAADQFSQFMAHAGMNFEWLFDFYDVQKRTEL
jgi:hypothetical protein